MTGVEAASEARSYGRSASLLTIVFGIAGVLVYLYFAVASHSLDAETYGQVVVLWSVVFVVSVTLFRPTEQLLARMLAEQGRTGGVLRVAAAIQLGVATGSVALALALYDPLTDGLFEGDATAFVVLVASLIGLAATYYLRGFFAGTRRFGLYAAVLTIESLVRLGAVVVYAVGLTDNSDVAIAGIAAGPLVSLVVAPIVIRSRIAPRAEKREAAHAASPTGPAISELTLARGSGFAAAVLGVMLSEQVIINAGPLFVRAAEDAESAGLMFNILMVARAPLILFQAVVTSLLPHLTSLWTRGDAASLAAFRRSVARTVVAIGAFAGFALAVMLAAGPELMQLAFGENFSYGRVDLAIVAVGMGFYLTAGTLTQAALAQAQVRRAAICWIGAASLFAAMNLVPVGDEIRLVTVGFTVTAVALCAALFVIYRRPHPHAGDAVAPGSAHELEARLSNLDEIA